MRVHPAAVVAGALCVSIATLLAAGTRFAVIDGASTARLARDFSFGLISAAATFATVGAVVVAHRPRNPVGWLFSAGAAIAAVVYAAGRYAAHVVPADGSLLGDLSAWVAHWAWTLLVGILALCLLLFPDGRLPSPRWRWVAWAAVVQAVLNATVLGLQPTLRPAVGVTVVNPIGLRGAQAFLTTLHEQLDAVGAVLLIVAVVGLVVRLRRSQGEARARVKLFACTGATVVGVFVVAALMGYAWLALPLVWPGLAASAGVAIARHRAFDIDLAVSRTLVVALLAGFVTVVYVVVAVGVGEVIGARGDDRLALLATAIAAVAFAPARDRIRRTVDRFLLGRISTPYEVLSDFSRRLRDAVPVHRLLDQLAYSLAGGTGAAEVGIWLQRDGALQVEAAWPALGKDRCATIDQLRERSDAVAEVVHDRELLGAISLRKRAGESVTPQDQALVADLAANAGMALRNARLTDELAERVYQLRTSRQRLVAAHDEERRRLERDLHDGAQPHLVRVKVKIGVAATLLRQGQVARAEALLEGLSGEVDEAIGSMRALASGVYPPLLASHGMVAALEAQWRSQPIDVQVRADGVGRYHPLVEATVYFVCLEAIQNIVKHAHASTAEVWLRDTGTAVEFQVTDNGQGFHLHSAPPRGGLQGMRERLELVDGALSIQSAPATGTVVSGWIPLAGTRSTAGTPQVHQHGPDPSMDSVLSGEV